MTQLTDRKKCLKMLDEIDKNKMTIYLYTMLAKNLIKKLVKVLVLLQSQLETSIQDKRNYLLFINRPNHS